MFDAKTLSWLQIIGALYVGWMSWNAAQTTGDYSIVVIAVLFLLMGVHHATKKSKKR